MVTSSPGGTSSSSKAKAVTKSSTSPAFVEKKSSSLKEAQSHPHLSFSNELSGGEGDIDAALMDNIEMLQSMLASIVQKENSKVYELYTQLRKHGLDRAANPDNPDPHFDQMKKLAFDISPSDALGVLRVFSIALNLVNAAEVHYKLRVLKSNELEASKNVKNAVGPLPMVEDSVRGTLDIIMKDDSLSKDEIYNRLVTQKVEIVLTAHPTEVNRKTLLKKYRDISEKLAVLDRQDLLPYERAVAIDSIQRDIAATWGSDEIRRKKPTPQQEAAGGNAVIETVLWEAVPTYLRKLDSQVLISLGKRLPIDVVPVKFASWIGGDRDGNPNVTPAVTREVVLQQRLKAAKLFLMEMSRLYSELAISSTNSRFSKEMEELAASIKMSYDVMEKYRRVIGHLRTRLVGTIRTIEKEINSIGSGNHQPTLEMTNMEVTNWDDIEPITKSEDLMKPLKIMYASLVETGYGSVADGSLLDTIRRLAVFGISLVPLDVREESTRHTLALDAITQYLGIGSYASWNEEARLGFLQMELSSRRPLFNLKDLEAHGVDDTVLTTLRTFETIAALDPESLGAYVISQSTAASDVLAVMLLQRQFGMTPANGKMMRVVPLFETLNDLTNAPQILKKLFQISSYVGAVNGKMEVMVGYSDSAKDAGRLAACWAQYTSQEEMVEVAAQHNIELTFFHGKGGTVGRGGNPALYRAVLSHPPKTVNGRFRVTEQGEMIRQNFGTPEIAERTLDIYTAAVLRERFVKHVEPKDSWRKQMERISDVSCSDYRKMVRDDPRFVPYFRQATPELELGSLNIGSRPAKRKPKGGIESLRAIPWTFAWAQTRLNLSAWLGVGKGLNPKDKGSAKELKEMYKSWPWFREIIDLLAMILSKTDFSISQNYDTLLVDKTPELVAIGNELREKLVETRQAVLDVSGSKAFAGPHIQLLRGTSEIRNPYVDSINCVQAELLKELRLMGEEDSEIKAIRQDALLVSINGIAQGMKNSG